LYKIAYLLTAVEFSYNSFTINAPSGNVALAVILPFASNLVAAVALYLVLKNVCGCPLPLLLLNKILEFLYQTKPAVSWASSNSSSSNSFSFFLQELIYQTPSTRANNTQNVFIFFIIKVNS
jgi:hypothetical protein